MNSRVARIIRSDEYSYVYAPPGHLMDEEAFRRLLTPNTLLGVDLNAKYLAWGCRSTNATRRKILQTNKNTPITDIWGPKTPTSRPIRRTGDTYLFWGCSSRKPEEVQICYDLDSATWGRTQKLEKDTLEVINLSKKPIKLTRRNPMGLTPSEKRMIQEKNLAKEQKRRQQKEVKSFLI